MMAPVKDIWNQVEKNETSTKNKKILKLVSVFIDALNTEEIHENVANIARDIQEMVIMKKGLAMMAGEPGPSPDTETLCQLYTRYVLESSTKGGKRSKLEMPTAWLEKQGVIYKGKKISREEESFETLIVK